MRVKRSALKRYLGLLGIEELEGVTDAFHVRQFMLGCKREDAGDGGGARGLRQPVSQRLLRAIHSILDHESRAGRAMWAALCLGWFFMLRASNYAWPGAAGVGRNKVLRRSDVIFGRGANERVSFGSTPAGDVEWVEIHVRLSKTDQWGEGFRRRLYRAAHPSLCVVQALLNHLLESTDLPVSWPVVACDLRGTVRDCGAGPSSYVRRQDVGKALQAGARWLGEEPSGYTSHSLRIGGATALHDLGVPDHWIMTMGFWKSATYLRYCRLTTRVPRTLARVMAHGEFDRA